ncbi:MAG: glucoamylase family protein [Gemmatimonadales bacterium]|nr:glucoamylase family protein [Gemmatimonadales bacterium]
MSLATRGALTGLILAAAVLPACPRNGPTAGPVEPSSPRAQAFLDTLEQRTFAFFWERTDPATGLTPDRWPTPSFSSIAAVGFALTAYPIGAERGYVTRAAAADRVLTTLRFFYGLPQGAAPSGTGGNEGFFYHFLDMADGHRFGTVELSTVDTAILLAGALFCQQYFDGADATEAAIRAYADSLYRRANWRWFQPRAPLVGLAWKPEDGFSTYDWRGYSEGSIIYVLALGSPTAAIDSTAWDAWTATYQWGRFHGYEHVGFAPLFGHQYSHVWIDFRGIRDAYMRGRGIDYFENSRRATYAQRAYAIANPDGWTGFGPETWGLSASDGPADVVQLVRGASRRFFTYAARGASFTEVRDDGTVTPTAAGGSIPFAPEIAIPALVAMRERQGTWLFGTYGFFDAFNPTWQWPSTPLRHGRYVAGQGWFDTDYLGIDQGPILAMIANHRADIVWRYMRRSPYIVRGLRRAGFSGGWLDQAP